MTYYVVHKGHTPGIYTTWNKCKKEVEKYNGAVFKKFENKEEATLFLKEGFGDKKPKIVTRRENDDKKNNIKIEKEISDEIEKIFIYTDGSCIRLNNIAKAGFGIYIPEKNIKISKPLLNQKITNNRAELTSIIECVDHLDENDLNKKICIFTDSQYSIYLFTGTGERYEKDGFKNKGVDVPNIDLIKRLLELKRTYNIVLLKVRSHTDNKDEHSIGNKIADKLANDGALFSNKSTVFDINNISDININELFELKSKKHSKKCDDIYNDTHNYTYNDLYNITDNHAPDSEDDNGTCDLGDACTANDINDTNDEENQKYENYNNKVKTKIKTIIKPIIKTNGKNIKFKNQKLSTWFEKKIS